MYFLIFGISFFSSTFVLGITSKPHDADLKEKIKSRPFAELPTVPSTEFIAAPVPKNAPPAGYVIWDNGGGFVHKTLVENHLIDKSAYIDSKSIVGPCAMIGKEAKIIASKIICEKNSKVQIRDKAEMEDSTSEGDLRLLEGARMLRTKGKGSLEVREGGRIEYSEYDGSIELRKDAYANYTNFKGNAELREKTLVSRTKFKGDNSNIITVRSNAEVVDSELGANSTIGENAKVNSTKLTPQTQIPDQPKKNE